VFCSALRAYELLTAPERERADRTICHYSGNPFRRHYGARNSGDGLRCYGAPATLPPEDEAAAEDGRMSYPLVWVATTGSGRRALMPHTRCIDHLEVIPLPEDITRGVPSVIVPRAAARAYLHTLMRRAAEPQLIGVQDWRPGDVGLWDNHAVWHSATGGLLAGERRVMHLTSFDSPSPPLGPPQCQLQPAASPPPTATPFSPDLADTATTSGGCGGRGREGEGVCLLPVVVAVTIGQTPRHDLLDLVRAHLVGGRRLAVELVGTLDGVNGRALLQQVEVKAGAAADGGSCPLQTQLRSGQRIVVSEETLVPLLQRQVSKKTARIHSQGRRLECVILLCAGGFAGLTASPSATPLIIPFEAAASRVRAVLKSSAKPGVNTGVPSAEQARHSANRWHGRLGGIPVLYTVVEAMMGGPCAWLDASDTTRGGTRAGLDASDATWGGGGDVASGPARQATPAWALACAERIVAQLRQALTPDDVNSVPHMPRPPTRAPANLSFHRQHASLPSHRRPAGCDCDSCCRHAQRYHLRCQQRDKLQPNKHQH